MPSYLRCPNSHSKGETNRKISNKFENHCYSFINSVEFPCLLYEIMVMKEIFETKLCGNVTFQAVFQIQSFLLQHYSDETSLYHCNLN